MRMVLMLALLTLAACASYPCADTSKCVREVGTDEQAAMESGFVLERVGPREWEWARYTERRGAVPVQVPAKEGK